MYKIIWEKEAEDSLKKIGDRTVAENIRSKVEKHLTTNPFWNGKPLKDRWKGLWRLHFDDYRAIYEIICEIREKEKEVIIAVILKIGEWRDIYGGELLRSTSKGLTITKRPKLRDLNKKVGRKIS